MKERPILFSAPMVNAILDGRKTMTRRVVDIPNDWSFEMPPQLGYILEPKSHKHAGRFGAFIRKNDGVLKLTDIIPCKYGEKSDRLWVKETWAAHNIYDDYKPKSIPAYANIYYHASPPSFENMFGDGKTRPSIFMCRWMSRITLEITDIRVERLQDITEGDARAEGVIDGGCLTCGESEPCGCSDPRPDARDSFIWLWDSINAKKHPWITNPWVWVISFKKVG